MRARILIASRVAGWVLVAAMLLAAAEGARVWREQVGARRVIANHNRRDFIQRVIVCRHPKGLPTRSWHACELEVQDAL